MPYEIRLNNEDFPEKLGKIVCIGRNYADHIAELNNATPSEPVLFIKPASCAVDMEPNVAIPTDQGPCHIETEIALLIGKELRRATETTAREAIAGLGIGFDLTLRQVQSELKEKGLPWEKAKSFDGACPLSEFIVPTADEALDNLGIQLKLNHTVQQDGNSKQMLTSILPMLSYISRHFTLKPGDIVLTGTPAGVTALSPGDELEAQLTGKGQPLHIRTGVVARAC